jgi:hypothetical protein
MLHALAVDELCVSALAALRHRPSAAATIWAAALRHRRLLAVRRQGKRAHYLQDEHIRTLVDMACPTRPKPPPD